MLGMVRYTKPTQSSLKWMCMQNYRDFSRERPILQTDVMFLTEGALENATSESKTSNLIIISLAICKIHRLGNIFNCQTEISQYFWAK